MAFQFPMMSGLISRKSDALLNPAAADEEAQAAAFQGSGSGQGAANLSIPQGGGSTKPVGAIEAKAGAQSAKAIIDRNQGQMGANLGDLGLGIAGADKTAQEAADAYVGKTQYKDSVSDEAVDNVSDDGNSYDAVSKFLSEPTADVAAWEYDGPTEDDFGQRLQGYQSLMGSTDALKQKYAGGEQYTDRMAEIDATLMSNSPEWRNKLQELTNASQAFGGRLAGHKTAAAAARSKMTADRTAEQESIRARLGANAQGIKARLQNTLTDEQSKRAGENDKVKGERTIAANAEAEKLIKGMLDNYDTNAAGYSDLLPTVHTDDRANLENELRGNYSDLGRFVNVSDPGLELSDVTNPEAAARYSKIMSLLNRGSESLGVTKARDAKSAYDLSSLDSPANEIMQKYLALMGGADRNVQSKPLPEYTLPEVIDDIAASPVDAYETYVEPNIPDTGNAKIDATVDEWGPVLARGAATGGASMPADIAKKQIESAQEGDIVKALDPSGATSAAADWLGDALTTGGKGGGGGGPAGPDADRSPGGPGARHGDRSPSRTPRTDPDEMMAVVDKINGGPASIEKYRAPSRAANSQKYYPPDRGGGRNR